MSFANILAYSWSMLIGQCIGNPIQNRLIRLLLSWEVTTNFATFLGEDEKSTMEHVSTFTTLCGEASLNNFYQLQLFSLSLTSTEFTWCSSLLPNSINNWADIERCFHDRFYISQPDISVVDLMNTKQTTNESVPDFLERFICMRSKCNTQF